MAEDERFRKSQSTLWTKKVLMGWSGRGPEDVLLDAPFTNPPFPGTVDQLRVALNKEFADNSPGFEAVGSQEWRQKIKQTTPAQADKASKVRDIRDIYHGRR